MNINTKSSFLEKKKQERKKTEDQIQIKSKSLTLQKNIRSFLARRKISLNAISSNDVPLLIFMSADISNVNIEVLKEFIKRLVEQPQGTLELAKRFILNGMNNEQTSINELSLQLAHNLESSFDLFFASKKFVESLSFLLKKGRGIEFLELSWANLIKGNYLNKLESCDLFNVALSHFNSCAKQNEKFLNRGLKIETILSILGELKTRNDVNLDLNIRMFETVGDFIISCLSQCSNQSLFNNINGFTFLFELLRDSLKESFREVTQEWTEKNKNLFSLITDEEELEYVQNIYKSQSEYEDFCERTLRYHEKIFNFSSNLNFFMGKDFSFQQTLLSFTNELNFIYLERKILFVYEFLSNDLSIKEMSKEKRAEFFSALNMRVITLDDEDFKAYNIFSNEEWKDIIQAGISRAFEITKKSFVLGAKKELVDKKMTLFTRTDDEENEVKILSALLGNLNKKCLRTEKFEPDYFINKELDNYLNTFQFGAGAKAIEVMLKSFPFVFRFQSRLRKMKEFIKADKLNHDRTLFLQDEVDSDLIVEVRRGHEFLDAFNACYKKDLRKKYQIIFFNEQGLEEEGIDGGGIIKEFINRVLKSGFSDVYGMFYETSENEILPDPDSKIQNEYEFVGKIVGKAVYEGINIDQKFAEPFLNLLIGKKNSFEDLQFIDKQIYKSMLDIRRMGKEDLEALQQTFTIIDKTPSGAQRYVNLKHISSENSKNGESILNKEKMCEFSENKVEFVLSYADFKCNRQLEEKTRLFRRGFLNVMKSEWLTMFSNQELNLIISGNNPNYSILELKNSVVYNDYNEKSDTIIDLWSVLADFTPEQKSSFLFFVTSCSRPPTMGFASMKPLICIHRSPDVTFLPTANTCMNVLRLPDYKNRQVLRQKLLYAINAKAGFEFA